MEKTYEGWSNRETWAINLHMSNNEGDYREMTEWAGHYVYENYETGTQEWDTETRQDCINDMADKIKEWTEEVFESVTHPEFESSTTEEARMFVSDVGSWWRADFYEIAAGWIDEAYDEIERSKKVVKLS